MNGFACWGTFYSALYLVQNSKDVWGEDVAEYRPGRMLERVELQHFMPFGGGRRCCKGTVFAQRQMRLQLAEIISRMDLRIDPSFVAEAQQSGQAVDIKGQFLATVVKVS